jgi:hypothetical protein
MIKKRSLASSFALTLLLSACDCGGKTTHARPMLSVTPTAVDFGTRTPGSRATLTLSIANGGAGLLHIASMRIVDDARGAFSLGSYPTEVSAGLSSPVDVVYLAPLVEGPDGASLVITSDADNAPEARVSLVGRSLTFTDGGVNPGFDAGADAGADAGTDAGADAGVDAGADAGISVDAGVGDAGLLRIPEAWYRFEETTGTVVLDSTGHGHNGLLEGAGTTRGVPGHSGFAYHFLGTDGRVHVPAAPSLDQLTGGSISAWISLDTIANLQVHQFASRGTGNNDNCTLFNASCGNLQIIYQRPPSVGGATTNCNFVQANTWTHVAVVNDGTTLPVYINGARVHTGSGGLLGPLFSDLYLGRREQGIFATQGYIDELKWWTFALTPRDVCLDAERTWTGTTCL